MRPYLNAALLPPAGGWGLSITKGMHICVCPAFFDCITSFAIAESSSFQLLSLETHLDAELGFRSLLWWLGLGVVTVVYTWWSCHQADVLNDQYMTSSSRGGGIKEGC